MDRNHDRLSHFFPFFFNFYYIWWKETGRDMCHGECIEVKGPLLRVSSLPPHGLQGSSSGLSPSGPARPTALATSRVWQLSEDPVAWFSSVNFRSQRCVAVSKSQTPMQAFPPRPLLSCLASSVTASTKAVQNRGLPWSPGDSGLLHGAPWLCAELKLQVP